MNKLANALRMVAKNLKEWEAEAYGPALDYKDVVLEVKESGNKKSELVTDNARFFIVNYIRNSAKDVWQQEDVDSLNAKDAEEAEKLFKKLKG